jgi:hypothetical protein
VGQLVRVAAASLLPLTLLAPDARANGRFPASQQLVFSPSDPNLLVLRTTYGVLVSHDQGCNWDWVCETAILGTNANTEDPFLGLTSSGAILAPYVEGLATSPDTGCSWSFAGGNLAKRAFADLALEPGNPHSAVTLASTYAGQLDGGQASAYVTQLFLTADDGATWTPFGAALDPSLLGLTVDLAPSDAKRVYVSAVRGDAQNRQAFLVVSTDGGSSFAQASIPIQPPGETGAYIAAVDPGSADRVYVRTEGTLTVDGAYQQMGRLLVTSDAGKTWSTAYSGGQLLGFALSPDGSKVYLGGPTDGLLVAPSSTMTFAKVSSAHVQCLAAQGPSLYVCADELTGYVLGHSENDGASVAPLLHIDTMRGPLTCGPGTSAAACAPQFASQAALLGGSSAPGSCAGLGVVADAGAGGGGGGGPTSSSGCGCRAAGTGGAFAAASGVAAAFAMAGARRRRGARSTNGAHRGTRRR